MDDVIERRDPPRAYAGTGSGTDVVRRAVTWLDDQLAAVGGTPLLYVPGKQNLSADTTIEQLSRPVTTATWRTLTASRWSGGPVIAAWPDRKHLAEIDHYRLTWALCVVGC